MPEPHSPIRLQPAVAEALAWGKPVVALESTLIAHGLPRPDNLALAHELEAIVRAEGGVPATIAVLRGEVGRRPEPGRARTRRHRASTSPNSACAIWRPPSPRGGDGATTVASTAYWPIASASACSPPAALAACIARRARPGTNRPTWPRWVARRIGVVCAGVKSILDVGATLERLETLNVTVIGYRTSRFPGFYLADSGFAVDWSVDTPAAAAEVILAQLHDGAVIIANPVPVEAQLDPALHARVLARWPGRNRSGQGIRGKAITPFLLDYFRAPHRRGQRAGQPEPGPRQRPAGHPDRRRPLAAYRRPRAVP